MSIVLHLFAVATLCALIVGPALTLFHELGHAVVPLLVGNEPVHMGPLFSLVALLALSIAAAHTDGFAHHLLMASCCLATPQLAVTAYPMRYPTWFGPYAGQKSDGLFVMEVLRREREEVL